MGAGGSGGRCLLLMCLLWLLWLLLPLSSAAVMVEMSAGSGALFALHSRQWKMPAQHYIYNTYLLYLTTGTWCSG